MTDSLALQGAMKLIAIHGPSRVMVSEFEATRPETAKGAHGISPDIIFIRDDGWSLGAPKALAEAAEALYPEQWTHVLLRPSTKPYTYQEYQQFKDVVIRP